MADLPDNSGKSFIEQAQEVVEENISNEQFGVSELAEAMNMSRSNLLRKIKKNTQLSASQFIRQVRLKKGMELLSRTSYSVSEVSFQVGFSSSSYFIKCFREHYGYPPGEVGKKGTAEEKKLDTEVQVEEEVGVTSSQSAPSQNYKLSHILLSITLVALVGMAILILYPSQQVEQELEKSIAVLPFKNESNHPSNLYFVNGLMESTLTKLQKLNDLRVISRTSAEKYRDSRQSIPEIAQELGVNYVVEGSSQRVGDQVMLSIQLIEANSDQPIWAEQYRREIVDIFALQNEVAKKIAGAIQVVITPSELRQMEKKPTENITAYEYYLKALEPFYTRTNESLKEAISLFEQAVEQDPQFSLAYANIAISYYLLDLHKKEKQYTEEINVFADKALLYDSQLAASLIAKALYYLQAREYRLALPHLEKALEYNPNSHIALQFLADFYFYHVPNTKKYLEYALKIKRLDVVANDSMAMSYRYLNLSNALIQNGFVEKAHKYIDLSLEYYPANYFAPHVKALIMYAENRDLQHTRKLLWQEWHKDTTRLDLLQETARFFYYEEKFDSAFFYYQKFNRARKEKGLAIYHHEDIRIGFVYQKMGFTEKANALFESYDQYCEQDESIYKSASLAVKYAHEGKLDLAVKQLEAFSEESNYQYWVLLFQEIDPMMKPLQGRVDYKRVIKKINDKFWEEHKKLKKQLDQERLL